MKPGRGGEIRFSGPPRNMAAVVPLDLSGETVVPITIAVEGQPAIHRAVVRPFGAGKSELRLRLPVSTPAGRYRGEVTAGGNRHAIIVEVEPVVRLRVHPAETRCSAAPLDRVEFGLSIENGGNVPFDVPKSCTFDLDDAEGQDRALGRSLRATLSGGERRVDRLLEELRRSHGGEAHVVVVSGAGRLEPGESGELTCALDVPAAAQAGHSYLGAWQLGDAGHRIVVDVTQAAPLKSGGPVT